MGPALELISVGDVMIAGVPGFGVKGLVGLATPGFCLGLKESPSSTSSWAADCSRSMAVAMRPE